MMMTTVPADVARAPVKGALRPARARTTSSTTTTTTTTTRTRRRT
jgi:hypothetical protein